MIKYIDINRPGYSIKCKIICDSVRNIKHATLFLHGFGGHKDNKAAEKYAETLLSKVKDAAVIVFDWPCHGSDVRKKLTLEDCDYYLTTAIEYCKQDLGIADLCAYGTSFGGYLVLKYLHDHNANPFRKIALRCPAISMGDVMYKRIMTEENIAMLQKGKDIKAGFDRKVLLDQTFLDGIMAEDVRKWEYFDFADDILILHGDKDEIVPVEVSKAFAENNVISFIEVEHADHRFQDLNLMKLAHSHIIQFFQE